MNSPSNTIPLLSASSLGRRAPGAENWLLEGIDLELIPGDRVALLGSSGAGKSLLLRALALLDPIDAGEVRFQNRQVAAAEVPAFRSQVIYLHQRAPLGEGTVETVLRQPFQWRTHEQIAFDRDRVSGWLDEIGRGIDFLELDSSNLSVGESQIVALLRAMQLNPLALLLDEPTSALDPDSTRLVENLVTNWIDQAPAERAFIWITHDPPQAERVGRKVWRMHQGRMRLPDEAGDNAPPQADVQTPSDIRPGI